jgi:hypothetical protein
MIERHEDPRSPGSGRGMSAGARVLLFGDRGDLHRPDQP